MFTWKPSGTIWGWDRGRSRGLVWFSLLFLFCFIVVVAVFWHAMVWERILPSLWDIIHSSPELGPRPDAPDLLWLWGAGKHLASEHVSKQQTWCHCGHQELSTSSLLMSTGELLTFGRAGIWSALSTLWEGALEPGALQGFTVSWHWLRAVSLASH